MKRLFRRFPGKALLPVCILLLWILMAVPGCAGPAAVRPDTAYQSALCNVNCGGFLNARGETVYLLAPGADAPAPVGSLYGFAVSQLDEEGGLPSDAEISGEVRAFFPTEDGVIFGKEAGGIYRYTASDGRIDRMSDAQCTMLVVHGDTIFYRSGEELAAMAADGGKTWTIDPYERAYNLWPTDEGLYFISGVNPVHPVYYYSYETASVEPVAGLQAERCFVVEKQIYFLETTDSVQVRDLFSYDLLSGEICQLTEEFWIPPDAVNFWNGYLLFSDFRSGQTIALNLATQERIRLTDQSYQYMMVCGDRLFTNKGVVVLDRLR